jgi:hypothetical protein
MTRDEIETLASVQLPHQLPCQLRPLDSEGVRLTLDGHCALAAAHGRVVLYDVEGIGLRHVDLADLAPEAWIP